MDTAAPDTRRRWTDPSTFCADVRGQLVGALTLYCSDAALAEEFAQEALVKTWQRWDSIDSPRAFAYQTAFNLARSGFRRRRLERRVKRQLQAGAVTESHQPDTATALAVRQAVGALPERQRQAIVARYYAELSVAESAAVLGCAEGTVKALTSQAIASLRRAGLAITDSEEAARDA